jgi:hypothetical protein
MTDKTVQRLNELGIELPQAPSLRINPTSQSHFSSPTVTPARRQV